MNYNILAVRKPTDVPDPFYPALDASLMPVMGPDDTSIEALPVRGLKVMKIVDGKFKPVIQSPKVSGEAWVTDHRVVVRVKNFDKQSWTADRQIGAMIWGAGLETTDFLMSKAYHRIKSRGQALVGHIYMPWIRSVAYQPRIGSAQPGAVRIKITKKLTDGGTADAYLAIFPDRSEDPSDLAKEIVRRCVDWWLGHDTRPSDEQRAQLERCAEAPFRAPEPGQMATVTMPVFRYTFNNNFSAPRLPVACERAGSGGVSDGGVPVADEIRLRERVASSPTSPSEPAVPGALNVGEDGPSDTG